MKITAAFTALVGIATATVYANFCDDTACSVNCGESVSVDNPGCLGESGRQSIAFHDQNIQPASLVFSPDDACSCQIECLDSIVNGDVPPFEGPTCEDISDQVAANSFRFIGGSCGGNNCPT